jgi:hypothetical protein
MFEQYETILGLINPGTEHRGFKACVTADYDLFTIWPSQHDAMGPRHALAPLIRHGGVLTRRFEPPVGTARHRSSSRPLGLRLGGLGNVPRLSGVDERLQKSRYKENYRYGDVSARILIMKTMLNTAIQGAGYMGGNAVHHNDEAGNFALAKGSLAECLPLIAFVPNVGVFAIETVSDFRDMVDTAHISIRGGHGPYQVVAKPEWLGQAGAD